MSKVNDLLPLALATAKWKADDVRKNIIIGQWAEDFSRYEITVPAGLRESLMALQHSLCDRITDIEQCKKEYEEAVKALWGFIGE